LGPEGGDEAVGVLGHLFEQGLAIAFGSSGVFAQVDEFEV
jgi:hypothetical protein